MLYTPFCATFTRLLFTDTCCCTLNIPGITMQLQLILGPTYKTSCFNVTLHARVPYFTLVHVYIENNTNVVHVYFEYNNTVVVHVYVEHNFMCFTYR